MQALVATAGRLAFLQARIYSAENTEGPAMNQWIENLQDILQLVLGNPGSDIEKWVLLGVSFVMMWVIVGKAGSLLGINNTRPAQTLVVTLLGVLLSLAALTAAQMYLPAWNSPEYKLWILIGVPLAVAILLVAPFMGLFQKANYITAVITWVLAVAGAALVILLVGAMFDSFASGNRDAEKGKAHKQELEEIQK
jgi:hypothetical protein